LIEISLEAETARVVFVDIFGNGYRDLLRTWLAPAGGAGGEERALKVSTA
jgi:hypothetical protein